jgi:hypothetical protein
MEEVISIRNAVNSDRVVNIVIRRRLEFKHRVVYITGLKAALFIHQQSLHSPITHH